MELLEAPDTFLATERFPSSPYMSSYERLLETYPHLHHSSAAPNIEERYSIDSAKQNLEEKRGSLRNRIDDLTALLREAKDELDLVQQQIDAHANLISPLRRIPPEILREIFQTFIPVSLLGLRDMTHAPPWTLLRVCRHWHDVCLMFGSLWSRITIEGGIHGFGSELC
ncbi:hypothetical protein BDV98DRAFT_596343 [Pterulicium gracile]|uniref:F-box domain-containing protein n=1 Tax=Pterulicium gracile TaxID=1884261 RepID=A0A5C3Q8E0_9AGAR|nr:hypothetical protein BDV98DRAFT_596343 [Pterula gracilis]